jgi:hypothetical protein
MQAYEVIVALGHMGRGKQREVKRYCIARNAVEARNIAFNWGAVKKVLVVRPCTDPLYTRAGERGLLVVASELKIEKVGA